MSIPAGLTFWEVQKKARSRLGSPAVTCVSTRLREVRPVLPPEFTFDFHCQRCRRPVRLVYEFAEVGMGGPSPA